MNPVRAQALKEILDQALKDFVDRGEVLADALAPALAYADWHDRELAGFICAVVAYGRVEHIKKSIHRVLDPMGPRPHQWLLHADPRAIQRLTRGWAHRFNTSSDMAVLLRLLQHIYRAHGSLEAFFCRGPVLTAFDLIENFVEQIETLCKSLKLKPHDSFWFFLPKPSAGSACKRLNLFLRWMVGQGPLDLRLWRRLRPSILIIPLDVHVLRQARSLRLTRRKQADWIAAEEVTAALRHLDFEDPVQFDFALCHLGMRGRILKVSSKRG